MKNHLIKSLFLCSLTLLTGCIFDAPEPIPDNYDPNPVFNPDPAEFRHTLLIYGISDGNLVQNINGNIKELKDANTPVPDDHALYFFSGGSRKNAYLIRVRGYGGYNYLDTLMNYGPVNAASTATMEQVIQQVRALSPAHTYGLMVTSHGSGWLPKGALQEVDFFADGHKERGAFDPLPLYQYDIFDPMYPQVKTLASGGSTEIEIPDLACMLASYYHDYIVFDACFMADIQAFYELRHVCSSLIASACEVPSAGFAYNKLTQSLFPYYGVSSVRSFAQAYYDRYSNEGNSYGCTVVAVATAVLDNVAAAFRQVVDNGTDAGDVNEALLQSYDRLSYHKFYDFLQFAEAMGTPEDYQALKEEWDKGLIYKNCTSYFITIPIDVDAFSGVSVYIPNQIFPKAQRGFLITAWNQSVRLMPYILL